MAAPSSNWPVFASAHVLMVLIHADASSMSVGDAVLRGCPMAYFPSREDTSTGFRRQRAGAERLGWIAEDLTDAEQVGELGLLAFAAWHPNKTHGKACWLVHNVKGCRFETLGEEVSQGGQAGQAEGGFLRDGEYFEDGHRGGESYQGWMSYQVEEVNQGALGAEDHGTEGTIRPQQSFEVGSEEDECRTQ
jgi:hypothetical protein